MKIHIYTTCTLCHSENSDFHYAVVKIEIFMTFTPHRCENLDFYHAVVKIQIFTFIPRRGEISDFHDIYTTPW